MVSTVLRVDREGELSTYTDMKSTPKLLSDTVVNAMKGQHPPEGDAGTTGEAF
jgi:hypothetical protein